MLRTVRTRNTRIRAASFLHSETSHAPRVDWRRTASERSDLAAYGTDEVTERHRHRYEFNNAYRDDLQAAGLVLSGLSPDGSLVEISEIAGHPWMVGCQFHPEFRSRPDKPHPLFRDFVGAALRTQQETPASTEADSPLASLL